MFKRALDDAKKEVDAISAKVGAVTITVKAAGGGDIPAPQVVLDEHPINSASLGVRRAIDPGAHVLRATADGYKPGELRFSTTEGGSADAPLMLEKDPNAAAVAAAPVPVAAPIGASSSSADMGADHAFEARGRSPRGSRSGWAAPGSSSAASRASSPSASTRTSRASAPRAPAARAAQSDLSSYHTMGAISTVGFIVAGVGAAVGAILLVTQPKTTSTTGLRVVASGSVVGLGSLGADSARF